MMTPSVSSVAARTATESVVWRSRDWRRRGRRVGSSGMTRVVEIVEVKREGGGTRRVVVGAETGQNHDGGDGGDPNDVVVIKDEPSDDD